MANASVVYVTASPGEQGNGIVAAAQMYAMEHELPLAVVHCIETLDSEQIIEQLKLLTNYEVFLAKHHIPLMVLLGQTDKVLPWFMSHTKPQRVFTDDSDTVTSEIRGHPYHWPGVVMTTAELQEMVAGDSKYCRPESAS